MGKKITQRTSFDDGLTLVTGHVSADATNITKIIIDIGSGYVDDTIEG